MSEVANDAGGNLEAAHGEFGVERDLFGGTVAFPTGVGVEIDEAAPLGIGGEGLEPLAEGSRLVGRGAGGAMIARVDGIGRDGAAEVSLIESVGGDRVEAGSWRALEAEEELEGIGAGNGGEVDFDVVGGAGWDVDGELTAGIERAGDAVDGDGGQRGAAGDAEGFEGSAGGGSVEEITAGGGRIRLAGEDEEPGGRCSRSGGGGRRFGRWRRGWRWGGTGR